MRVRARTHENVCAHMSMRARAPNQQDDMHCCPSSLPLKAHANLRLPFFTQSLKVVQVYMCVCVRVRVRGCGGLCVCGCVCVRLLITGRKIQALDMKIKLIAAAVICKMIRPHPVSQKSRPCRYASP